MLMGLVQHLDVPWLLDVNRGEHFSRTATRLTVARQPLVLLLPWLLLYTDCYEQRSRLCMGFADWSVRMCMHPSDWTAVKILFNSGEVSFIHTDQ